MTILPTLQAVELPDGLTVPYLEQGDRDGVPLILLHGLTDSHRSFEPVLAALPDTIHALRDHRARARRRRQARVRLRRRGAWPAT